MRRPTRLAAFTALIAVSAYAGAVALAVGWLDASGTIDRRLPLHSPVIGGAALVLVVALPMTVVTRYALRRDPRSGTSAMLAGIVLEVWLVVELAFIRQVSWLQALYACVGAVLIVIGHAEGSASHIHGPNERARSNLAPKVKPL